MCGLEHRTSSHYRLQLPICTYKSLDEIFLHRVLLDPKLQASLDCDRSCTSTASCSFKLMHVYKFSMQVHANGVITFDVLSSPLPEGTFPNGIASIAPFWTAVDQEAPSAMGSVYYRLVNSTDDNSLVSNFSNIVRESFRNNTAEFTASQMLIVTWDRVKGVGTEEVCMLMCVSECVCVCVCERERERESECCQCENSKVCKVLAPG